jgi:hypothetical protein
MGPTPGVQLSENAAQPQGSVAVPAAEQPAFDAAGNPIATYVAPGGRATARQIEAGGGPAAKGGGAAGGSAAIAPVAPANKAQAALSQTNADEIIATRKAGDQAASNRNINDNILRLSADTNTGPGTQRWANIMGGVSSLWGGTEKVNNYQELGKYLQKNAIANMQAMGGSGSDARLDAAVEANGSTHFDAGALQDVTKFNAATNAGLASYRAGMDKAVGLNNAHPEALPQLKSDWVNNMDVNVFRAQEAIRRGDKNELAKIRNEIGTQGMSELSRKQANLRSLETTGNLPPQGQ